MFVESMHEHPPLFYTHFCPDDLCVCIPTSVYFLGNHGYFSFSICDLKVTYLEGTRHRTFEMEERNTEKKEICFLGFGKDKAEGN